MRVLLIEDYLPTRRALTTLLEIEGMKVEAVGTLSEGKELVSTEPDFIFLDVNLPNGSGLDMLRFLRTLRNDIPVVVCSGHPEHESEVVKFPMTFWLDKPPDKGKLHEALSWAKQVSEDVKGLREKCK